MSRIGKLPVEIPAKVKVGITNNRVTVEGPKGTLAQTFSPVVEIVVEDNVIKVSPKQKSRLAQAMYGTTRSILANMVKGVVDGYTKDLIIQGTGFKAAVKGSTLDLALGYSHPINMPIPEGVTVTVTDNTKVKVEGPDKQLVGEVAARIKRFYPVEPYKAKGVQIVGQYVRRKEGKKTA